MNLSAMELNLGRIVADVRSGIAETKWNIEDMVDLIPELSYNTRPKKTA